MTLALTGVGCASRGTTLRVPASSLTLTDAAPALARPPKEGAFDSNASREVVLRVLVGTRSVKLRVFARVDVWTTVHRLAPVPFVVRETWGKLGERSPRKLRSVRDEALSGVLARVRPERDGSVSFFVEVAAATPGRSETVGIYHGARIELSRPTRHGYRFWGRAHGGGPAAQWGGVIVELRSESPANSISAVRFTAGEESGFVAGAGAAETFLETWTLHEPRHIVADGVERKEYRLVKRREAAGFTRDRKSYGTTFQLVDL